MRIVTVLLAHDLPSPRLTLLEMPAKAPCLDGDWDAVNSMQGEVEVPSLSLHSQTGRWATGKNEEQSTDRSVELLVSVPLTW